MQARFIFAAASVAALLTLAGPAQSQANRTFVSGQGSDSNPCSLAAPCRSFAQALSQTNAGGEIVVLDSAGYGSVTINKAISINAPDGIEGGVTVASATDAIDINIGASDVVNLRGLTLVGGGVGNFGIKFTNLGTLNIQNCVIRGFAVDGIEFQPVGTAALNVSDTIVSNVASTAVTAFPSGSGTVTAVFNRVQVIGSGNGFLLHDGAGGALNVTIANSVATNNGSAGIAAEGASGVALTRVVVSNSVVSNNATGVLESGANSTTYLAKNTIAGNATAFTVINNGALFSFGDNYINGNVDDGGTISLVAAK
jgi:hypothetical protein